MGKYPAKPGDRACEAILILCVGRSTSYVPLSVTVTSWSLKSASVSVVLPPLVVQFQGVVNLKVVLVVGRVGGASERGRVDGFPSPLAGEGQGGGFQTGTAFSPPRLPGRAREGAFKPAQLFPSPLAGEGPGGEIHAQQLSVFKTPLKDG